MEDVAQRAVVKYHDLAEIRLDLGKIFDVSPIAERTVLPIVASHEVFTLDFQPVNDWIGVLLHRSSEDDQVVPFTDLTTASAK
jgi:hypothetical protein